MSGNAVLCALAVAGRGTHTALYYAWTVLVYVCGIWICAVQRIAALQPVVHCVEKHDRWVTGRKCRV